LDARHRRRAVSDAIGSFSVDAGRDAGTPGTTATVASGISSPDNLYVDAVDRYFTTIVDSLNYVLAATAVPR